MASFELRVPSVKVCPAYGCVAEGEPGRVAASWLMGQLGGGRVGKLVEVEGIGGWFGGSDEIMVRSSLGLRGEGGSR